MELIIEIFISIIISLIPIILWYKQKKRKNLKFYIITSIILLIGCLIRLIAIEKYPIGLNQDEASVSYEAYSLLHYGIDRNGMSFPVHFIAWGSGQNALYGYLLIPFIKIFGLTPFSTRLPMALIGCITLLFAFYLFKDLLDNKKAIFALIIFTIIPWHIFKSRWALESNIFPDFVFYSLVLIHFGLKTKKRKYFIISSIILGLSTYSYGTSYLFIPIYLLLTYGYLLIKKQLKIKDILLYLSITTIIALPMIIFVIINLFNLSTIKIFNITIPKLYFDRMTNDTTLSGNFIQNTSKNILNGIKIILKQDDHLILNTSSKFGVLYKFSLPLIVIGIYDGIINKKKKFLKLNNILFISSIFVMGFMTPNINRMNIIWIPLIIYLIDGIMMMDKINKYYGYILVSMFVVVFISLPFNYYNGYQEKIGNQTFDSLDEAINFASKKEKDYNSLYITNFINQPYIYYLYYNKVNVKDYYKERVIEELNTPFQHVLQYKDVYFDLPSELEKNKLYIIDNTQLPYYNLKDFKLKQFKYYTVVY